MELQEGLQSCFRATWSHKAFCFSNKLVLNVPFFFFPSFECCAMLKKYLKTRGCTRTTSCKSSVTALAAHGKLKSKYIGKKKILQPDLHSHFPTLHTWCLTYTKGVSSFLFPQPKIRSRAVKLSRTRTWRILRLLVPSASSSAKASFQVQSFSTIPQWINSTKEEDRNQLPVLKTPGSYATVTPPAHAHGHGMKNCPETLLLQTHNNLWTQTDVQRWKGKRSCRVPFLPWHTSAHTSQVLPMANPTLWNSEKKRGKKNLS